MKYKLDDGKEYEISYSQELQKQEIEAKKKETEERKITNAVLNRIKIIGIIALFVGFIIAVFLGIIIFTDVLQNVIRTMVGC